MRERPEVQEVLRLWLYRFVISDGTVTPSFDATSDQYGLAVPGLDRTEADGAAREGNRFPLGALRASGPADMVSVGSDRPDAVAVAAGLCDYSTAVDGPRCLQSGGTHDTQQALGRARFPLIAGASS